MTSQGSPLSRFQHAVAGSSAINAIAAAAELGSLDLGQALALVCLLAEHRRTAPYGPSAVRWASRYFQEKSRDLAAARAIVAALDALSDPAPSAALEALRASGRRDLADVVRGEHAVDG
jgi:hypothetical protein